MFLLKQTCIRSNIPSCMSMTQKLAVVGYESVKVPWPVVVDAQSFYITFDLS